MADKQGLKIKKQRIDSIKGMGDMKGVKEAIGS